MYRHSVAVGTSLLETISAAHFNPPQRPKAQCLGLNRMINASGYKVWPAEVEALMYEHHAIREVCVIGANDARRGETVKAFVVLDSNYVGKVATDDIIAWAREHMASYKVPRIVDFVRELPKSASGKILWRQLQEEEAGRTAVSVHKGE